VNAIYTIYCHALIVIQRNFWPLLLVTFFLQFPALMMTGSSSLKIPHKALSLPVGLFGFLFYWSGHAAILSLIGRREERMVTRIYLGVIAHTWPIVRVGLNVVGLAFVLWLPFLILTRITHVSIYGGNIFLAITSLIASSKLQVGEAVVVAENCTGKAAISRAWRMTSGVRFKYVAVCLVIWAGLDYLVNHALGPPDLESFIRSRFLEAPVDAIEVVLTWCIYSWLLLQEVDRSEVMPFESQDLRS
jgi:hypothetical protein